MTDIAFGEHSKKIVRLLLKLAYKYLKVDAKIVDENLRFYPNPVIKNLNDIIVVAAGHIKPYWQRTMLKQLGQLGLWMIAKDTAYRDAFFWILYKILKKADKLLVMLEPYVKPPEEWIPNLWHESKNKTEQLRKEGKISKDVTSFEESMYVRSKQQKRYNDLMKKKKR